MLPGGSLLAGLKCVFSAGRAALCEIVDEGLGIPVPGRGKSVGMSAGEILEGATWHEVEVVSMASPVEAVDVSKSEVDDIIEETLHANKKNIRSRHKTYTNSR